MNLVRHLRPLDIRWWSEGYTRVSTTTRKKTLVACAEDTTLVLSKEEGSSFIAALQKPFRPNRALAEAMERGDKLGI